MSYWRVLCYHAIEPRFAPRLRRQLEFLRSAGFTFGTVSDGLAALADPHAEQRVLTVTFDDGDRTICDVAQPILDELQIHATLFLTTDYVRLGRLAHLEEHRAAVSWQQVERWLAAGHELGSHTHTHVLMAKCSEEQCMSELMESRRVLERELGLTPRYLAYPYGLGGAAARRAIQRMGNWRAALTGEPGWNHAESDPLGLCRDSAEPEWSVPRLQWRLSLGHFEALRWLVRRLQGRNWVTPPPASQVQKNKRSAGLAEQRAS
jgi:peptidoglycan/xylan/chitin deacetylase (PgdA/CDA1 family)